MINKNINLNTQLTIQQGDTENIIGYATASIDTNGYSLNFSVNILNKQALADNLETIKLQYNNFIDEFKATAQGNGFNFV